MILLVQRKYRCDVDPALPSEDIGSGKVTLEVANTPVSYLGDLLKELVLKSIAARPGS